MDGRSGGAGGAEGSEQALTPLVWLPEAREDIGRLFELLVDVNPVAAAAAIRLIQQGAERLIEHPELGRPMDDTTRRRELVLPFGATAYVLRYRLEGEHIIIIRVWHGREERT